MKRMKFLWVFALVATLFSCSDDDSLQLTEVIVRAEFGNTETVAEQSLLSGLTIEMTDANGAITTSQTDADGCATFRLPAGLYNVATSAVRETESGNFIINGNVAQCVVEGSEQMLISLPLTVTTHSARGLLIKEIYNGGCQKDDGSGVFQFDKCVILYNNSDYTLNLSNLAIGMVEPYNAEASHSFMNNGVLEYEADGTLPLINGIWYFADALSVEPYSEVVVNICGAIDNTQTYSNSINYANPNYYCMYDPSTMGADGKAYSNTSYYPAPAEVIPTSHYLKAVKYGMGNAWPFSALSPAVVLFQTNGIDVAAYAGNADNIVFPAGKQGNLASACLSIPREWVIDGVEVYNAARLANCQKRLTADIDNGYVELTNGQGHALVRRIDSEQSAKAGHAVYVDTNNSSNDFVEAEQCSLRALR